MADRQAKNIEAADQSPLGQISPRAFRALAGVDDVKSFVERLVVLQPSRIAVTQSGTGTVRICHPSDQIHFGPVLLRCCKWRNCKSANSHRRRPLRIEFIQIVDFGTRTVVPEGTDGRIQG
jgi:hypothetical protein